LYANYSLPDRFLFWRFSQGSRLPDLISVRANEASFVNYAEEVHRTLHEMAVHFAGESNLAGQLMVQAAILGDPALYIELHRRTRERLQSANGTNPQPSADAEKSANNKSKS
jgi:hypothetical protein